MSKNEFATIGDLPEGTPIVYEYGTMSLTDPKAGVKFVTVKGYVGPRHTNRGGRERVVIMRTKTTGARLGSVPLNTSVKVR